MLGIIISLKPLMIFHGILGLKCNNKFPILTFSNFDNFQLRQFQVIQQAKLKLTCQI